MRLRIAAPETRHERAMSAQERHSKAKPLSTIKSGRHTSFGVPRQIDAGVLNMQFAEVGRSDDPAVTLPPGKPHNVHCVVGGSYLLAEVGIKCSCLSARLRFHAIHFATQTIGARAVDAIAFMEALKNEKATIVTDAERPAAFRPLRQLSQGNERQ